MQPVKTIRLILGDQLNINHSWFQKTDPDVLYTLMEIKPESEYVTHHIQKITAIFAGMRAFGDELEKKGHRVKYFSITSPESRHSFKDNLELLVADTSAESIEYMEPDEYRLDTELAQLDTIAGVTVTMVSTEHFFTERSEVKDFFEGKKQLLLESFYRDIRKRTGILMEDGEPVTGRWNYDQENRKKLPRGYTPPAPLLFNTDISQVLSDIREAELDSIGTVQEEGFIWPITRDEALEVLKYFVEYLLPQFGTYQDALTEKSWSVHHSRISSAMNMKLISPDEVIKAVVDRWSNSPEEVDIAQAEGFIRQILGWREYMRGIYWMHMPEYASMNYFEHQRPLPSYFWTGETKMRCVSKAVDQSLEYAYAHHIQRLMVTGNFCLLAGIEPSEVDAWYLGIYIDAFEWVEITNTRGMSQYADGGIVGSKPYISSANYIHKMGDHCASCSYDHKKKVGEGACPFNSLYWHFIERHRDKLAKNPRMSMMYRVWEKNGQQDEIIEQAESYLAQLETL